LLATTTALAALLALPRIAEAGPAGGSVVAGSANISQSGPVTNINQSSNRAIINWQSFSVGAKETVNFHQPSAASATLNRVIGNETSVISGALNANGQVFIVNSAGVLFSKGAQVNVGGLVASTLDIANTDFMTGKFTFSGTSSASVINQGRIKARPGGYVALLGKTVSNDGVISARLGTVSMTSGDKITLNFEGNSLFDVTIDKGTLNALVANNRAIRADGGQVILTAKAADELLSAQVNNTGIVQARTIAALKGGDPSATRKGTIKLFAYGGTTNVSGKLDASAPHQGDGGFIETSGSKVKIADTAVITTKAENGKTGTWLVDPFNLVIAASGGDMTGATLSNQLALNNVTLTSGMGTTPPPAGDDTYDNIFVNDAVSWSANTTLTLGADNSIFVNAPITGTGAGSGLALISFIDTHVNAASALNAATITVTAGAANGWNNININAPQTWTTAHSWDFSGNLNINAPINWTGTAPLVVTGTNMINVKAAMTGLDANSRLSLAAPDINFNVVNAFNVNMLTATASNNVNIGYAQNLSAGSSWALSAAYAININSPITESGGSALALNAGTNINVNAQSALNVAALTAIAGKDVNINEAQTWTTVQPWAFTGNLNINAPISWAGALALSATNALNVNAAITGAGLALSAGTDINVAATNAFNVNTLSAIAGGNVTIAGSQTWTNAGQWKFAGNNVNVSGPVNWSAGTLTLNAAKNVFVNAAMNATGTAGFVANYGHVLDANGNPTATVTPGDDVGHTPGINADTTPMGLYMALPNPGIYTGRIDFSGTGGVTLGGQNYSVINSVAGLDAVASNLSGNYVLGNNLSNLDFANLPSSGLFTGNFNGLGHSLSLAPVTTLSIGSPLSVASLKNTNVVMNATGDINVNAPIISGAGLLTFNAGNNINLDASISGVSSNTGSFAFFAPNMTIAQTLGIAGANIFLNAPVTWPSDAILTLTANRDININRDITATGTNAGLAMNYGGNYNILTPATYSGTVLDANGWPVAYQAPVGTQYASVSLSGSNSSLNINGNAYTLIRSMSQLDLLDGWNSVTGTGTVVTANGNFALAQNLDANGATYTSALLSTLGGTFTGLGHKISNLTINVPGSITTTYIGLIGTASAGTVIRDIGLVNASVTGRNFVGTLLGRGLNATTVSNVYATGSVTATGFNGTSTVPGLGANAGGLIGQLAGGSVTGAYADVSVTGFASTGGLIGNVQNASVSHAHAKGDVTVNPAYAGGAVGGLVGGAGNTAVSDTYATGAITGKGNNHGGLIGLLGNGSSLTRSFATGSVAGAAADQNAGGLVGEADGAPISYVYATGNVNSGLKIGGLIGWHNNNTLNPAIKGNISNAYATGNVSGVESVGGFVGSTAQASTITNAYAAGNVASSNVAFGGFVGSNFGFISYSYATGLVGVLGGPKHAGGFAGINQQIGTIENSYSTGNVFGSSIVGGVAGTNLGLVSHSWALGDVTGTDTNANGGLGGIGGVVGVNNGAIVDSYCDCKISGTGAVGGVAGWSPVGVVTNSYYNIEKNPGLPMIGIAPGFRNQPTVAGGGGLTNAQFGDIQYYLNHTIDKVLADRSAAAAAQTAAAQAAAARQAMIRQGFSTANVVGSSTQTDAASPPNGASSAAGRRAATNSASQEIGNTFQSIEEQARIAERRARQRALAAQRSRPGFGATIRSIEINGERFNLQRGVPAPDPQGQ
jgi:filamentous hemagglutinin family protein